MCNDIVERSFAIGEGHADFSLPTFKQIQLQTNRLLIRYFFYYFNYGFRCKQLNSLQYDQCLHYRQSL